MYKKIPRKRERKEEIILPKVYLTWKEKCDHTFLERKKKGKMTIFTLHEEMEMKKNNTVFFVNMLPASKSRNH